MSNDNKELAVAIRELAKAHGNRMTELSASISHLGHEVDNLGNAGAITAKGATNRLTADPPTRPRFLLSGILTC